jgi:putative endonuclease
MLAQPPPTSSRPPLSSSPAADADLTDHASGCEEVAVRFGAQGTDEAKRRSSLGLAGEDAAMQHLVAGHGLRIVARRWRVALDEVRGELDLLAHEPATGTLVVCEVKTRRDAGGHGGAIATLTSRQQRAIRRLATLFLASSGLRVHQVRFDLVALDVDRGRDGRRSGCEVTARLTHIPDAW